MYLIRIIPNSITGQRSTKSLFGRKNILIVSIFTSDRCWSMIGRQNNIFTGQDISIGPGCERVSLSWIYLFIYSISMFNILFIKTVEQIKISRRI